MGMFDTVIIKCPACGETFWAQSKGGDCCLDTFNLNDAPAEVLADANRHAPFQCEECGCMFELEFKFFAIERRI